MEIGVLGLYVFHCLTGGGVEHPLMQVKMRLSMASPTDMEKAQTLLPLHPQAALMKYRLEAAFWIGKIILRKSQI